MNFVRRTATLFLCIAVTTGCSSGNSSDVNTTTTVATSTSGSVSSTTATTRPVPGTAVPAISVPEAATVDRNNADAVTDAVLATFYTVDTDVDGGTNDAARRALPLLTPTFANGITRTPPTGSPGAEWLSWAAHRATTTVVVAPLSDSRPPDSDTSAYRIRSVQISPHGRDGVELPPANRVVYVVLERTSSGWSVANVSER